MPRAPLALAFASLLLVPASLAGCGDEDEQPARTDMQTTSTPEATVPQRGAPKITVPPDTERYRTAPAPAAPSEPDYESAPAPPAPVEPDIPQNDRPPPAGTPADRFEKECEAKPEACG